MAGYSRLMGLDEAGTAQALREHRAAADPLIAQHGGPIVSASAADQSPGRRSRPTNSVPISISRIDRVVRIVSNRSADYRDVGIELACRGCYVPDVISSASSTAISPPTMTSA